MEENKEEIINSFEEKTAEDHVEEITAEELEELLLQEKRRGRNQGISIMLLFFAVFAVICSIILFATGALKTSKSSLITDDVIKKADYIWKMNKKYFLWDDKKDEKLAQEQIYKGIMESLDDPYSVYYSKEEFDSLTEDYSGEYSGIGAYITQNQDTMECYISRPMPGSPAEAAGLVANDYIVEVDGENVLGLDINVVVSKIKGPEGTNVTLGIKHDNQGEIDTITVERKTIEVSRLESEMLEDNIGYIWVYEFEGKTETQFDAAYDKLKAEGMEGLIIDLRDNPGGDLDIVTKMADKFLDGGTICYTKDKNGKGETFSADSKCEKIPMVIITNGNSASASEIFTGSLKDRGVAKVVGNTTYGKGIVQVLFGLDDGSGLKITEAEYYLPNDECIHGVGIEPDYEVDLDYEAYRKDKSSDAQKKKAIEVMKGLIK